MGSEGRILVVDDDAVTRAVFVRYLTAAGLQSVEAADGREALDRIADTAIDAVLLDSVMPGISGLGVLAMLRAQPQTRTLPVILVTVRAAVEDRVRGLEAGATDYLVKPVDPDELVARVRAHLRSQDVWVRSLANNLEERTAVTQALCNLRVGSTAEEAAARACREIATLRGCGNAMILWATPGGGLVPLAAAGRHAPAFTLGRALAPELALAVRRRAMAGPWAYRDDEDSLVLGGPALPPGAVAAPFHAGATLLGVLVLLPNGSSRADEAMSLLPAAIDFAAVAGALLAPLLTARHTVDALRAEVAAILGNRRFGPVFQPIVDLASGKAVGYEVLTRFADGGLPATRFAEAAQSGLGIALEQATASAGIAASFRLPPEVFLSVNVSPAFALEPTLHELTDQPDRPVVVELTEHDPIDDYGAVRAAVMALGPHVQLSVDDAGAGYATLHHVLALQPDYVKLDRSWVAGIDENRPRQALVAGLVSFADRTGCKLVAEGIETTTELETLRELRVELGQGFLLGRPEALTG